MTKVPFQLQKTRLEYHGRKYTLRVDRLQLPNGLIGEYEYIIHPGAAMAVPITAEGKLIMVRQYRFAVQQYLLEFPAGTLEVGESPDLTIKRELEEETGYRGHSWQKLGSFMLCPGYSDEVIHAYLAQDLEKLTLPPAADDDEDIEVEYYSRSKVESLIHNQANTLIDSKSITAFYMALPFM